MIPESGPHPTEPPGEPDDGRAAGGSPPSQAGRLPRDLVIVLGLAAGVVVAAGIRAASDIIGPVFLALVLTVSVDPLRGMMVRRGAPRWLATLVVIIGVYAILIGLVVATAVGVARFVGLMPQYADELQAELSGLRSWLAGMGVTPDQVQSMLADVDRSSILGYVATLLSGVMSALTSLVFVVTLLIFLAVDGSVFGERMVKHRPGREPALTALGNFAMGTRRYFVVGTVFGGIVAVLDGLALVIMGFPAAGLWALLAFVTNYIPNIGFVIGLIPPALLGLLIGGPSLAIWVIVVYCILNFVIQSVLQPKFVGDAVGLTTTMSFLSLIIWAFLLGPLGAILAIPASLLVKAVMVDVDPDAKWLQLFLGDEPDFSRNDPRAGRRPRRRQAASTPAESDESPGDTGELEGRP